MSRIAEDNNWMRHCHELAQQAARVGEVPVAAALVMDGRLVADAFNTNISDCDPSAHAEINVLRRAGKLLGNHRLTGATLYVTLEPCIMCAGAIVNARVKRCVFGAYDKERGAAGSVANILQTPLLNHQCLVQAGIMEHECEALLNSFFEQRRVKE